MADLVRITGLAEVQRMMREAPRQVTVLGLAKALKAGGLVIEQAVADRTPERDEEERSGEAKQNNYPHLIDTLRLDVEVDTNGKGGDAKVHFGSNDYIANFVETGHEQVMGGTKKNGGRVVGYTRAHPFVRPAADASEDAAIGAFSDSLSDSVDQYFS